jgi:nitrate reductase NapD
MNISGVIVHARPERIHDVRMALERLPGVEVHAVTETGRLVVTVEEGEEQTSGRASMELHNIDGVLSAAMIYHHYEDEFEPSEKEASS